MQVCGCQHGLLERSKGVLLIASSSKSGRVRPARMRNALPVPARAIRFRCKKWC